MEEQKNEKAAWTARESNANACHGWNGEKVGCQWFSAQHNKTGDRQTVKQQQHGQDESRENIRNISCQSQDRGNTKKIRACAEQTAPSTSAMTEQAHRAPRSKMRSNVAITF